MIIVKIKGGLGNQLFQYSFAKLIEKITGDIVKLDLSSYDLLNDDNVRKPRFLLFKTSLNIATKEDIESLMLFKHKGNSLSFWYKVGIFFENCFNKRYFLEKNREYVNPHLLNNKLYFDGYWQSKEYIYEIESIILKEFIPNQPLSEKTLKWKKLIDSNESVFVGVRKGDYSSEKRHYGNISPDYYDKAMTIIEQKIKQPVFYIFSNDIEWCKTNLIFPNRKIVFRESEDQTNDFEELFLMSSCKHAIISNSTFHWWGAYLIKRKPKVVCCPSKWFFDGKKIDLYEDDWIRVEV